MTKLFLRLTFLFLLTWLSVACSTNPITGRSQLLVVSEQSAIAESAQAYQDMMGSLDKKGRISTDEKLNLRVQLITDRLIDQAVSYRPVTRNWAWSVKVIDEPKTVNAFCMAGGKMAIYTGLIEKIHPTDDEIAEVMGHEISHALLQHSREQMSEKAVMGVGVALIGASAVSSADRQTRENVAALGAMTLIMLPHSRRDEDEADRLGIELAAKAGYNPHAAVTLWEKMLSESGNNSKFDWLSTHPASRKRIETLQALEPEMAVYYRQAKKGEPPLRAWTSTSANERVIDMPAGAKSR
ncbi:MAG: M48 family metallopeptidase [Georgfuchsia sp.]